MADDRHDDRLPDQLPGRLPEMRAADTDREQVAERLREAVAEGRLEMAEFEERLDAAYKARTYGELEPLTRDLPVAAGSAAAASGIAPVASGAGAWAARIGRPATSRGAGAVCGGFSRRGKWSIGRAFTAFALMGGGDIDLRDADFEDREIVIRCFTIMGGIDVIVPPELDVEVTGFALMGGFDDRGAGEGSPGSPRVRVTGFALMGGVDVKRKPKKPAKQQKSLEK